MSMSFGPVVLVLCGRSLEGRIRNNGLLDRVLSHRQEHVIMAHVVEEVALSSRVASSIKEGVVR